MYMFIDQQGWFVDFPVEDDTYKAYYHDLLDMKILNNSSP